MPRGVRGWTNGAGGLSGGATAGGLESSTLGCGPAAAAVERFRELEVEARSLSNVD